MELKTATGAPSMKFALAAAAPAMQLAAGNSYAVLNSAGAAPAKAELSERPIGTGAGIAKRDVQPFAASSRRNPWS